MPFLEALGGYVVTSDPDYGYDSQESRRKVALWSKARVGAIDHVGDAALPSGRYAAADVASAAGTVSIVGVCIPWSRAHVSTGRRDRRPWQDHMAYIEGLTRIARGKATRTIIAGDFNQKYPKFRQPKYAAKALADALESKVWGTAGLIEPLQQASIDHVVTSSDLAVKNVQGLSNYDQELRLSDHFGIACDVHPRPV